MCGQKDLKRECSGEVAIARLLRATKTWLPAGYQNGRHHDPDVIHQSLEFRSASVRWC